MGSVLKKAFLAAVLALVLAPGAALITRKIALPFFIDFSSIGLFGQTISAETPRFDFNSVISGQTQPRLARWLAERMGRPREFYIRLNNSVDLFLGRSSNPNIFVGNNHELYTAEMLRDACLPAKTEFTDDMATGLKRAQDLLVEKGKAFILVLSPNKAAIQPENLPAYCRQQSAGRA